MTTESERPFRVVLIGGKDSDMISGHAVEPEAQARCSMANGAAEALGIKARYEVRKVER